MTVKCAQPAAAVSLPGPRVSRTGEFQRNKQRDPGTEDLSAGHSAALRSAPTYYAPGLLLFQPTTTTAPSQQLPDRM